MDTTQLASRPVDTVAFSVKETEMLEELGASLPAGWKYAADGAGYRWFRLCRDGQPSDKPPIIITYNTPSYYSITVYDEFRMAGEDDLRGPHQEVFSFDNIADALSNPHQLICEFMQTENPSDITPSAWTRCMDCGQAEKATCKWLKS